MGTFRGGKIHPQKDDRNGVIEYGFPGSQMLEYGFPGGLQGSTNPKITNDHFFPLRSIALAICRRSSSIRTI